MRDLIYAEFKYRLIPYLTKITAITVKLFK